MIRELQASIPPPAPPPTRAAAAPPREPQDSVELGPRDALDRMRALVAEEARSLEGKLGEYVPGELLVKTREQIPVDELRKSLDRFGFILVEQFEVPEVMRPAFGGDLYLVRTGGRATTAEGMAMLGRSPFVEYVTANQVLRMPTDEVVRGQGSEPPAGQGEPNDLHPRLWGLDNTGQDNGKAGADIDAVEAWRITTGKREGGPVVAVIDTGIDYNHVDLARNVWVNPDPQAPDRHGYNFVADTPDPMDDNNHGTHVSGTIAAEGNNGQGVVGVAWQGRVMGLKFLSGKGSGSTADAIKAVLYATRHGARITSNSWGGGGFNQALLDAFRASPALHVLAAGNDSSDNDKNPRYPASYPLDNAIVVAASDRFDEKAYFSNWGKRSVHLAAPGMDVFSTVAGNGYDSLSGTSMATPHVTGVAALIASEYPGISNEGIKARILNGVDHLHELRNHVSSGGRLNAARALEHDLVTPAAVTDLRGAGATITGASVAWTATGDDGAQGTAATCDLRWSDRPIASDEAFRDATPVETEFPGPAGTAQQARVALVPSARERIVHFALRVYDNVGNASPMARAQVAVPAARVVFEDRMEDGAGSWTPEAPWGLVEEAGHGKVWASSPDGNQDNGANTSLTTRLLDLRGVRRPALMYQARWDLEKGYDWLNVEVSDNAGQTWTSLDRATFSSDWARRTHDLSAFAGKQVLVRFRVETDKSVQSKGVRIDDVVVAGE